MREKQLKIKEVDETTGVFSGYLSTYENKDRDGDVIKADAFKESVANKSIIPMLFNHDKNKVIGKLELSSDDIGLKVVGTLNTKDPLAANVHDLLQMGALDSMSVGMLVDDYTPVDKNKPFGSWNIEKATAVEGSVVTVPANDKALISSVKELTEDEYIEFMKLKSEKRLAKVVEYLNKAEAQINEKLERA